MATTEERLSRIEGGYEHLATKADLANLENRLTWRFFGAIVTVATLAVLAVKYLPGGA